MQRTEAWLNLRLFEGRVWAASALASTRFEPTAGAISVSTCCGREELLSPEAIPREDEKKE
jgi:hypothetical protein